MFGSSNSNHCSVHPGLYVCLGLYPRPVRRTGLSISDRIPLELALPAGAGHDRQVAGKKWPPLPALVIAQIYRVEVGPPPAEQSLVFAVQGATQGTIRGIIF